MLAKREKEEVRKRRVGKKTTRLDDAPSAILKSRSNRLSNARGPFSQDSLSLRFFSFPSIFFFPFDFFFSSSMAGYPNTRALSRMQQEVVRAYESTAGILAQHYQTEARIVQAAHEKRVDGIVAEMDAYRLARLVAQRSQFKQDMEALKEEHRQEIEQWQEQVQRLREQNRDMQKQVNVFFLDTCTEKSRVKELQGKLDLETAQHILTANKLKRYREVPTLAALEDAADKIVAEEGYPSPVLSFRPESPSYSPSLFEREHPALS
jgi:hypothetical protein